MKKKIFVAVPSCRDPKLEFSTSMINLASYLTAKFFKGEIDGLEIKCLRASLLPLGRELLLGMAVDGGFTHILWIDDDTKFSNEAVDSILSRDVDYVSANMCRKQLPISYTAYHVDGSQVDSAQKDGIEEVNRVGLGFCLMSLETIKNIPAPLFEVKWCTEKKTYVGEDIYLCDKLKANGIKLYVDHTASNLVGHIGDYSYEISK